MILEIITQFTSKDDPNLKRLGLIKVKKNGNKRRVVRSGMGNDEEEYYDEYDSEYGSELEAAKKNVLVSVSEYDDESAS